MFNWLKNLTGKTAVFPPSVLNLKLGLSDQTTNDLAEAFNKRMAGINDYAIGQTVIIRTYAAGVWCGILSEKAGKEVILKNARRMWKWWCQKSISLSGVAVYGIIQEKSKIAAPVDSVWLEAIEIIPVHGKAAESIMQAPIVEAEKFN